MNPKISVIVPCYNGEDYIDRCISSIIGQTIGVESLEIILVDDASTDRTAEKMKAWEEKYPEQILVITYEENLRQGGARNVGMSYASADYISFVDSDDWLEPDTYETLYRETEKCDTSWDLICGKTMKDGELLYRNGAGASEEEERLEYHFESRDGFCWADVSGAGTQGTVYSNVGTLIRREILTENGILFPEHMAYEDNYFTGILRLYLRDCVVIDRIFYHYVTNPVSTTNKAAVWQKDRLEIELMLLETYMRLGAVRAYYGEILKAFVTRYWLNSWNLFFTRLPETPAPALYEEMKNNVVSFFPNWRDYFDLERIKEKMPDAYLLFHWLETDESVDEELMKKKKEQFLRYR